MKAKKTKKTMLPKLRIILVFILLCSLTITAFANEQQISTVTINLEQKNTSELPSIIVHTEGCTLDSTSWLTTRIQPGSENKVKITVKANSGYMLSNPSIVVNGGKLVSTSLSNSEQIIIIVKSDPLYVVFPEPTDVEWDGSFATWNSIDEDYKNFKYEVKYNGKTYTTSQNFYDLSDKVKKNKGYFSVRVVPKNSKAEEYSSPSEWVESDEFDWEDINNWCPENSSSHYPPSRPNKEAHWEQINGYWYFYDGNVWLKNDWITWNGRRYYLRDDGTMATGEEKIKGHRYFFNSSGEVIKDGWVYSNCDNCWYFINGNYNFVTGKQNINGQNYYFHDDGKMATGLQRISDAVYYFGTDGAMRIDKWEFFNDKWHYFSEDGTMAVNRCIGNYHFNQNGEWDNY